MTKILIADDNPVSLRFFADALGQLGMRTELAEDGLAAVAKAERTGFDLLLLDARMPGLDGIDALVRIRTQAGPSRAAIALATTADASERTRVDLIANGFVEVVTKPVTLAALRDALARHLGDTVRTVPSTPGVERPTLDDAQALSATGGDAAIVDALRGLLIAELDALPGELAAMAARNDLAALRDRLHRLDASAGFCGAPGLASAGAMLRSALDAEPAWPRAAVLEFLATCAGVRRALESARADATR